MTRRTAMLIALLAGLLALTAVWSHGRMLDGRRAALAAGADLQECRRLAGRIEKIRDRPRQADGGERVAAEVTGRIEAAAKSAGIPADRLIRITPEAPQRLGDTAYKEKPTQVMLKNITLRQLTQLAHALVSAENGLHARSIRLTAPRKEDTGDLWSAELTLTYLIYDPPRSNR